MQIDETIDLNARARIWCAIDGCRLLDPFLLCDEGAIIDMQCTMLLVCCRYAADMDAGTSATCDGWLAAERLV